MEHEKLVCYGCGHGAANQPYPGRPSGERPCGICKRNPEGQQVNFIMSNNNVKIFGPKDMFIATDRLQLEIKGLYTHHPWW